ncbi:hypothetical protein [Pontixanthobacter aquaemixtae]|uniref:Uncharacterized protein n=1 Tax=Pontixanthobacter aquaemixtae TaxID=1958940 RepID=A0A844ZXK8_9SPHN|nr:hypothetical protein [Pontixanthobacter aquaemixtae]MXO91676.1 hypothetical protein [Pontixanthobacter aquaemixtae]
MGKIVSFKSNRPRKLGQTIYTDHGPRLAPLASPAKEYWFIGALAMFAVGTFLIVLFW